MRNSFLILLRLSLGLIMLMVGIMGILIPITEAWILVVISIPVISPEYSRKIVEKVKMRLHKR